MLPLDMALEQVTYTWKAGRLGRGLNGKPFLGKEHPAVFSKILWHLCLPARKKCGCQYWSRWQGTVHQEQRPLQWLVPCVHGLSERKSQVTEWHMFYTSIPYTCANGVVGEQVTTWMSDIITVFVFPSGTNQIFPTRFSILFWGLLGGRRAWVQRGGIYERANQGTNLFVSIKEKNTTNYNLQKSGR